MIGNRYAVDDTGYTVLEEGDINRQTLTLDVRHFLVCLPDGAVLEQAFTSRAAAEAHARHLAAAAAP